MSRDYLPGTDYCLEQPGSMYHFNSDSCALGRFIRVKHRDFVLDIGCGTGVLLLYAAVWKPAGLTGIDLFPEVLEAAGNNLKAAGLAAELVCTDVQDFRPEKQFDVILCNPPYFRTGREDLKNENRYLRAARHEEYLTPDKLFANVRRLLKTNGSFWLVHRAERVPELFAAAGQYGLYPNRMKVVFDDPEHPAKCVLLQYGFSRKELTIEPPEFRRGNSEMQ